MKKLAFALLILLSPSYLRAQELHEPGDSEQIDPFFQEELFSPYASLVLDIGLTFLGNPPKHMQLHRMRSYNLAGSLYYNIPIRESHFMVSPGIGLFSETYSLKNQYTLTRDTSSRDTRLTKAETLLPSNVKVQSSTLNVKYVDLITEFRFNANRLEPEDGFFVAVGGKLGIRAGSAATTIDYKEDNQEKTRINQESYNLNMLHYGVLARMGWGRFGIFYSHTLSSLFNEKGPSKETTLPFSIGLSLNLL